MMKFLSLLLLPLCLAQPDWCQWVPLASQQYVPDCSGYVNPASYGYSCATGASGYQVHLGDILPNATAAIKSTLATTSPWHLPQLWQKEQKAVAKLRASGSQGRLGTALQIA